MIGYGILMVTHNTDSNADMIMFFQILIGSFVAIIPSRMAQHDATVVLVSFSLVHTYHYYYYY
jgi:hypothetical protein